MNRRDFLKSLAVVGAGAVVVRHLDAAPVLRTDGYYVSEGYGGKHELFSQAVKIEKKRGRPTYQEVQDAVKLRRKKKRIRK